MSVDQRAIRRQFLDLLARRRRLPGAGSDLAALDKEQRVLDWWGAAEQALRDVPHAVVGAVAVNAYAPPRQTSDIDFAVAAADLPRAENALSASGWQKIGELAIVVGSAWRSPGGHTMDLIALDVPWAKVALEEAQENRRSEMPTIPLPYLVLMKLAAARTGDMFDVSRMLGRANDQEVSEARAVVRHYGDAEDRADFEQLLRLGKLERGIELPDAGA